MPASPPGDCQFELAGSAGSGRLLITGNAALPSKGRPSNAAAKLCASIAAANAASPVLVAPAAAPLVVLAQDAQHGLVMAAAVARSFAAGSNAGLSSMRRRQPAAKAGALTPGSRRSKSSSSRDVATAAAAAPAAAALAAAPRDAPQQAVARQHAGGRGVQQFLAGGIAGAVSKTLVAPLERVSTILMAERRFSVGQAARHAWRDGPYRGHAATLIKIFPASAIQFAVFNGLKDRILAARQAQHASGSVPQPAAQPQPAGSSAAAAAAAAAAGRTSAGPSASSAVICMELANHERLLAGAAAGAAAASVCYPLEACRTMMSVAGGVRGSLFQVGQQVVASHGVRGLYKGFRASLLGDILGNSLGFTAYELGNTFYRKLHGGASPPPHLRGLIGACSAACVVTLTMPLEVVRRRLQIQGLAGRPVLYRGTLDCLCQVVRQEGVWGFYSASLPAYLKVPTSLGFMYFTYELLMASAAAQPATQSAAQPAAPAGSQPAVPAAQQ